MAFLAKFLFFIAAFLAVDAQKFGGNSVGVNSVKFFNELENELVSRIDFLFGDSVDFDSVNTVVDSFKNVFFKAVDFVESSQGNTVHDIDVVKSVVGSLSKVFGTVFDFSSGSGGFGGKRTGKGRTGGGRHFNRDTY